MNLNARLTHEKIRFDEEKDTHLVISLTAPHLAATASRPPVCVIPVLDVSGSMEGPKLHYARQSVLKLIEHLAPGDFCGVVVFSTEAETLAPPAKMTQARKDALKAAVGQLSSRSNTNLAGGMLVGLEHARAAHLPAGLPVRVILFTDGLANAGLATKGEEIMALLKTHLGRATLSAFGYGDDADQELLRELSTAGKGNYAYVQKPEDALTAFARELGGLLSSYAQNLELRLTPAAGHRLTDVVSDVDAREVGGAVVLRVPELLADETRHLVLGLRLAPQAAAGDTAQAVVRVEVSFERLQGGRLARETLQVQAHARFVPADEAQLQPAAELDEVVALAQLVRAQIDAEEAARAGRFGDAFATMAAFARNAGARGHGVIADTATKLAQTLRNTDAYDGSAAYRSSMRKGVSRAVSSSYGDEAEADLRAMKRGQSTPAQQQAEASFGASGGSSAPGKAKRSPKAPGPTRGGTLNRRRSKRW